MLGTGQVGSSAVALLGIQLLVERLAQGNVLDECVSSVPTALVMLMCSLLHVVLQVSHSADAH